MPTGPHGEKRPSNPIAAGVHIGRLATGEAKEEYVNKERQASGKKGGKAMTAKRRREIAWQSLKHGGITRNFGQSSKRCRTARPDSAVK